MMRPPQATWRCAFASLYGHVIASATALRHVSVIGRGVIDSEHASNYLHTQLEEGYYPSYESKLRDASSMVEVEWAMAPQCTLPAGCMVHLRCSPSRLGRWCKRCWRPALPRTLRTSKAQLRCMLQLAWATWR